MNKEGNELELRVKRILLPRARETLTPSTKSPRFSELHAKHQSIETMQSCAYWRKLCPRLHIGDENVLNSVSQFCLSEKEIEGLKAEMLENGFVFFFKIFFFFFLFVFLGFFRLPSEALEWDVKIPLLVEGILELVLEYFFFFVPF